MPLTGQQAVFDNDIKVIEGEVTSTGVPVTFTIGADSNIAGILTASPTIYEFMDAGAQETDTFYADIRYSLLSSLPVPKTTLIATDRGNPPATLNYTIETVRLDDMGVSVQLKLKVQN